MEKKTNQRNRNEGSIRSTVQHIQANRKWKKNTQIETGKRSSGT